MLHRQKCRAGSSLLWRGVDRCVVFAAVGSATIAPRTFCRRRDGSFSGRARRTLTRGALSAKPLAVTVGRQVGKEWPFGRSEASSTRGQAGRQAGNNSSVGGGNGNGDDGGFGRLRFPVQLAQASLRRSLPLSLRSRLSISSTAKSYLATTSPSARPRDPAPAGDLVRSMVTWRRRVLVTFFVRAEVAALVVR